MSYLNTPFVICEEDFQKAWAQAVTALSNNSWVLWNLIVQITSPIVFNADKHEVMKKFASSQKLIGQDQVAYTIFPFVFNRSGKTRHEFYTDGMKYFERIVAKRGRGRGRYWGSYFNRMVDYECPNGERMNQLETIISSINSREKNYGAAHVIVIPYPKELKRKMGGPCLNYITIQVETAKPRNIVNLLAVYRNHDFTERAYGNYYGLCKLLEFIATATDSDIGNVTCVSSHAYTSHSCKAELRRLSNLLGETK